MATGEKYRLPKKCVVQATAAGVGRCYLMQRHVSTTMGYKGKEVGMWSKQGLDREEA